MATAIIRRALEHVKGRLYKEGSGHDWFHTERIWKMAQYLQSKEGGEAELIELAAILHCAGERDIRNKQNEKGRSHALNGILDVLEIEGELREQIIAIIQLCHFKGKDTERATTLEGKIVQDANFLDVLGALGLARGFTAGGYLGRIIHDPAIKPHPGSSSAVFQKRKEESTSLNYFYEKPLVIVKILNTPTARKIAESRLEFTRLFLKQFHEEWEMKDVA